MLRSKGLNPVSIRAVDGGLQLGLGVFFLVASTRPRWIRAGLGAAMLSGGGLAFGRIVGMWKEQLYEREQLAFVAFEALIVLAALAAFVRARAVFEASLADRRRTE